MEQDQQRFVFTTCIKASTLDGKVCRSTLNSGSPD